MCGSESNKDIPAPFNILTILLARYLTLNIQDFKLLLTVFGIMRQLSLFTDKF